MFIRLREYERIYQIISAIIESEGEDPSRSCIYYSLLGAAILQDHYKANASVRCGLATYYLGGDHQVLVFGERAGDAITGGENGYHCWVEVDDWIIDFMAPRFKECAETDLQLAPKMFQKRISEMSADPNDMREPGDFFLNHDQALAESILLPICEHPMIQDLVKIASEWFKKPPKDIPDTIPIVDQNRNMHSVQLKQTSIRSKW